MAEASAGITIKAQAGCAGSLLIDKNLLLDGPVPDPDPVVSLPLVVADVEAVAGGEIGLEIYWTGMKKGVGNNTEPLVFLYGSPTGS